MVGVDAHFGRGVGRRKMKALCEGLDIKTLDDFNAITEEQIVSVDKFSYKTAAKVLAGMAEHAELFNKIQSIIGFKQQVTSGIVLPVRRS